MSKLRERQIEAAIRVLGCVSEEYEVDGSDRDAIGRVIFLLERVESGEVARS